MLIEDNSRKLAFGFVLAFAAMSAASAFAAGTLPSGYTEVEYIQPSGNARIVTDYTPQPNIDKIEAVVEFTTLDATQRAIWCARASFNTYSWTLFVNTAKKFRFDYRDTTSKYADVVLEANSKYTVTAASNRFDFVSATQSGSYTHTKVADFTCGGPITLFSAYYNGTGNNVGDWAQHRLYGFKVWRDGELIHYFVPCKDSNNVATMVDICDNPATLTNDGAGTFTAGPEGHFFDDSLFGGLTILPIPDQVNETFDACCPVFVVTNMTSKTAYMIGGDIVSQLFDVVYTNNYGAGVATVTATGKGEYAGEQLEMTFSITATKLEDDNIFTTDTTARRLDVDGKSVYVFKDATSSHTVTAKRDLAIVNSLLVGGGGGGGRTMGGGGGGGGVNAAGVAGTFVAESNVLAVAVGAGGDGSTSQYNPGANGGDTSLSSGSFSVIVPGGGGGGSYNSKNGANGASGGGGANAGSGGAGIPGFGFPGAASLGTNKGESGGGGGAGHAGYRGDLTVHHSGNGGEGVSNNITGVWAVYGGGGGAGGSNNGYGTPTPGLGGLGGGGDGGKSTYGNPGTDGLGGGGGGGGYGGTDGYGGNGGSGIAILTLAPTDFKVDPIPVQYVVSGGCTPGPVVRYGGTLLVKDTDYTVAYANNTAPGMATVTITGIGTYADKVGYAAFEILNRLCAKPTVAEEGDGSSWADAMSWT
ncbi:MAG: hypothetical protein J5727_01490, partial [Kiritimatiellae bacterium]|nr:hypothetical protein [Kiritimatiellia bacterium]